jgi:succinylglutamate desuccinylase
MERIIGDYGPPDSERLVLCIGGMHGNEVSGVLALENVFAYLQQEKIPLQGRFVGLKGNVQALKAGKRFIEKDLNRLWADDIIVKAMMNPGAIAEYLELKGLFEVFLSLNFSKYHKKVFLDLHNTSAERGTFVLVEDLHSTQYIVKELHAPLIIGLHHGLLNTSIPYMHFHGFESLAFESGKIGSISSVHNHVLTIYQVLWLAGLLRYEDIPYSVRSYTGLMEETAHLPSRLQIAYAHAIAPQAGFLMKPGYKNFDLVTEGEVVATDRNGPVTAPLSGYMLMPLYQPEGSDGFFLVVPA